MCRIVIQHDAGRLRQQGARFVRGEFVLSLDVDGLGMADIHRDANRRRGHVDRVIAHDLPRLIQHLHLFLRVAGGQKVVNVRQAIEGDLVRIDVGRGLLEGQQVARLF